MQDIFKKNDISKRLLLDLKDRKSIIDKILDDEELSNGLGLLVKKTIECVNDGNKLLFCGNGGSAADCQHIVAEFVVKMSKIRSALPAVSLTSNASIITAISNDFGFNKIFSRQIESIAKKGDIVIGISTSGKSENILEAFKIAKEMKVLSIAITGQVNSELHKFTDINLVFPTKNTQLIQEIYLTIFHIICGLLEDTYE